MLILQHLTLLAFRLIEFNLSNSILQKYKQPYLALPIVDKTSLLLDVEKIPLKIHQVEHQLYLSDPLESWTLEIWVHCSSAVSRALISSGSRQALKSVNSTSRLSSVVPSGSKQGNFSKKKAMHCHVGEVCVGSATWNKFVSLSVVTTKPHSEKKFN